jgi:predicted lipoprotein
MSSTAANATTRRTRPSLKLGVGVVCVILLLVAMALNTKVVNINSQVAAQPGAFDPAAYGAAQFPKIQSEIESRAVDAATLAAAIAKDPTAAGTKYGVQGEIGPEFSVKFTGVAGAQTFGVYTISVPGVSNSVTVRVQTGPAINGTDVRDATGSITFGQFTNQIDYQNAGSALNNEVKSQVLAKVDTAKLTGKTVSIVGVFQLVVPNSWLITPVRLDVQ